jgi:hypothetical protein
MKKGYIQFIMIAFLAFVMSIGLPMTAMAAPSVQWQTESVYYDNSGQLVMEGYFYNNGTATITGINWIHFQVYFRGEYSNWWLQAETVFENVNVFLFPGSTMRWRFNIYNVSYQLFDYWNVQYNANYNYQF